MVSNLFSIRFDDSNCPSTDVLAPSRNGAVREYLAGPENALLSHVIATETLASPTNYPILFFGPTGVGKSHVLRGLVERCHATQPAARICFKTGADFCRDLAQAHEVGSLSEVRQTLRDLDYFALDDLQSLTDKPYAQFELLSLLDVLKDRQATVVLTSRVSPHQLTFTSALKSRLGGGLTVPIQVPANTTRARFVRQFAEELELDLPDDVVDRLAAVTPVTIPELRGLVLQLQHSHLDEQRPLDVDLVAHVIQQRAGEAVPGVRDIIKKVARYFGLTVAELTGPSRRQTTVLARDTAIYLTRHLRHDSFEQIGTYFGGRDHSTVMHAFQKITKKRSDSLVNAAIVELVKRLGMQHCNL